jgi:F0F1-type ATP synthase assembly protein I
MVYKPKLNQSLLKLSSHTACYAHVLNLVLSKSCNSIKSSSMFYSNLSGFASFFFPNCYKAIIFRSSR